MKKAKILSAICAAAVLVSVFAGCGSTGGDKTTSGATGDNNNTGSDKGTKLVWWTIGEQPKDLADGLAKINEYTNEKMGTTIDLKIASWGDWDNKMNTIVNSGEAFDMMFTNNTKYSQQVNLGAFADITEAVKTETPALYESIPEIVWSGTQIGGKVYAIPSYKDSSLTQYYVFDDAYVQKYNLDVSEVKTVAQVAEVLGTIKEGEGKGVYPLQMIQTEGINGFWNRYDDLTLGLPPIGVRVDDGERKVVSVLEQDEIMNDLKIVHQMYKDEIINPDAATTQEPYKGSIFFSGQGFPGAEVTWQINGGVEKYTTVQQFGPMYTTGTIQGSMNAISKNSKFQTEALKYLELVNTDSALRNMLAFGVEGTHFEYTDDTKEVVKKLTDTWTLPSYTQGTFFNMATIDGAPADQWDQVKLLNEQADASTCLGYALDISNLSTEVANCKSVWDKYRFELVTGTSNPEEMIPVIVAEMKAVGMDKIMEEAQKQIDAFFA